MTVSPGNKNVYVVSDLDGAAAFHPLLCVCSLCSRPHDKRMERQYLSIPNE